MAYMQSYQNNKLFQPKEQSVSPLGISKIMNNANTSALGAVGALDNFRRIKNENTIRDLLSTSNAQNIQHRIGQLASLSGDTTQDGVGASKTGTVNLMNQSKNEQDAIDKMAALSGYGKKATSTTAIANLLKQQGRVDDSVAKYKSFLLPDSENTNLFKQGTNSPNWNSALAKAKAERAALYQKAVSAKAILDGLQQPSGNTTQSPELINFLKAKNKYLTSPVDLSQYNGNTQVPSPGNAIQKIQQQGGGGHIPQQVKQQIPVNNVNNQQTKLNASQQKLVDLYNKTGNDTHLSEMVSSLKLADGVRKTFLKNIKKGMPVKDAMKLLPAPKKALPTPKGVKVPIIDKLNKATNPISKIGEVAPTVSKAGKFAKAGGKMLGAVAPLAVAYDMAEEYDNRGSTWFDFNDQQKAEVKKDFPQFFDENGIPKKEFLDRETALFKSQGRDKELDWKSPFQALDTMQSQIAVDADLGAMGNEIADFFGLGDRVVEKRETNFDRYKKHLKGISQGNPDEFYGRTVSNAVRKIKNSVDNVARNNPQAEHPTDNNDINLNTERTDNTAIANASKIERQKAANKASRYSLNQQKNSYPVGSKQWNDANNKLQFLNKEWKELTQNSDNEVSTTINNIETNSKDYSSAIDFEEGSKTLADYIDNVTKDNKYADNITPHLSENGIQVWRNIKDGRDVKVDKNGALSVSLGDSSILGSDPVTLTTTKKGSEGRADLAKQYVKILVSMTQDSQSTKEFLDKKTPGQQNAFINLFESDSPFFPKDYGNNTFTRSMSNDSIPITYEWKNRIERAIK